MVVNVLKHRSINLIKFYCCIYSGLPSIINVVVWNSIRLGLIKKIQDLVLRLIDDWNRVWFALEKGRKSTDIRWYVIITLLLCFYFFLPFICLFFHFLLSFLQCYSCFLLYLSYFIYKFVAVFIFSFFFIFTFICNFLL